MDNSQEAGKFGRMDKKLTAFVLGGSGGVGKSIVKALAESPGFEKVTLLGRRVLELPDPSEYSNYAKFDQKIIDFENLSKYSEDFKGYDVGFSSLGSRSGTPNYYRINHDYVVETAKLAKEGGVKHFHLVTGSGTSTKSLFEWTRVKGEVEEKVSNMDFERISFYRPSLVLLAEKNEHSKWYDNAVQRIAKAVDSKNCMSVEADVLGRVMVENTFRPTATKSDILENNDINAMAKEKTSI